MNQNRNNNNKRGFLIYVAIILLVAFLAFQYLGGTSTAQPIEYNKITTLFQENKIASYTLDFNTQQLTYVLFDERDAAKAENRDPKVNVVKVPALDLFVSDTHELVKAYNEAHPDDPIQQYYVPFESASVLESWLPTLLMIAAMCAMWYFIMKQTRGGGNPLTFGKAKVRAADGSNRVTFDDVAGADEEKKELEEIVDFLRAPSRYNSLGARIPKGVLLMGPPGTGKTLLAKAVAGEAGVPFFSISGSDFVEMYVGVGASRVRDLFDQAKKSAPSIIFIDEIDAVGRHRGAGLGGGHDEREQTLNQLLVEMDGFGSNTGVIVMAATNRKDILDPALMRPGRFDRQIVVNYPDVKGREEILRVHTRNKPIAPDVDLAVIARSTGGFTGADLENLTNEAALLAARKHKKAITMEEIEEATIKVVVGPEKKSHVITEAERHLTAYHEAGHAIATYYCPTQDKVHQISIIPRGMAGGFTLSLPEKDIMYRTKATMEEDIVTLLGGRVAEALVLKDISTGASNDIERATKLARAMVTRYGFSDRLGPMVYGKDQTEVFLGMDLAQERTYSENIAGVIDEEIRGIIDTGYEKATAILSEHIDQLHDVATYLKEFEKIDGAMFARYMSGEATIEQLRQESRMAQEENKAKQRLQDKRAAEEMERKRRQESMDQPQTPSIPFWMEPDPDEKQNSSDDDSLPPSDRQG